MAMFSMQQAMENPRIKAAILKFEQPAEYTTKREEQEAVYQGAEKAFQAETWAHLKQRGFRLRTHTDIQREGGSLWAIHLRECEGNPILLDWLLIDSKRGRCAEIELKVKGGSLEPSQRWLVQCGHGVVCWSMAEFVSAVDAFLA